MRIGIDVRMWNESGIGRYVRNLVKNIVTMDTSHEFVLFGLSSNLDDINQSVGGNPNVRFVESDVGWYSIQEQAKMPVLLYRENLDLVHFPHFNVPILYFKPFVVTIHDLTHFAFSMQRASTLPSVIYQAKQLGYKVAFSQALNRSKRIITVSEYVKDRIIEKFGIAADKIAVTYESSDLLGSDDSVLTQSESKPYFFYVGNAHPHKNIEFLLRAFAVFCSLHPEYSLVLAGKRNYFWDQVQSYAIKNKLNERVVFKGYVSDTELRSLYENAAAFIFPSLSEGFGLPLLEAMLHKCPVLSSSATCLPEIAGDAALYFDPVNEATLVDGMDKIANDTELRLNLVRKGSEQAAKFSWQTMASQTLKIYNY